MSLCPKAKRAKYECEVKFFADDGNLCRLIWGFIKAKFSSQDTIVLTIYTDIRPEYKERE